MYVHSVKKQTSKERKINWLVKIAKIAKLLTLKQNQALFCKHMKGWKKNGKQLHVCCKRRGEREREEELLSSRAGVHLCTSQNMINVFKATRTFPYYRRKSHCDVGTQPATVVCKMWAQSEYTHVAHRFFARLAPICMLSVLINNTCASELSRKFIKIALLVGKMMLVVRASTQPNEEEEKILGNRASSKREGAL